MKDMKAIQTVPLEQLYASPAEIGRAFSLGHSHVYKLIDEMKHSSYKSAVVAYGKVVRVRIKDFENFWREYAAKN